MIKFLNDSISGGKVPQDNKDSLEFAVESIADAYGINKDKTSEVLSTKYGSKGLPELINAALKQNGSNTGNAKQQTPQKDSTKEDKEHADALKMEGNKAMAERDFETAIEKYSEAIKLNPANAIYFSNRAAAYSSARKHELALKDAQEAVKVNPNYAKAWSRMGLAKYALGDAEGAMEAYAKGLKAEGSNHSASMEKGYQTAKKRVEENENKKTAGSSTSAPSGANPSDSASSGSSNPLGGLSGLLNNPQVMQAAQQMMQNPDAMRNLMNNPQLRQMAQSMGLGGNSGAGSAGSNGSGNSGSSSGSTPSMQDMLNNPALRNLASQFMNNRNGNQNGQN